MSDYKFRFSVVVPIYNVEKYLEETIESVLQQDIGFQENIQMILVNDGSPDGSEAICLRYQELYPDNIVYVRQKNSGVSAARNHGMEFVNGKYVNFLDADDKWSPDAFSHVWDFFEKREKKIDLVACPQKFFEAREDYHPLYFKFVEGERIIDILDKYDYVQLHITASFIKSEVLTKYKFDESLRFSEDAKFVGEIILDKLCYGVTNKALHYYRKRLDDSSAVQNKIKNKDWYLKTPRGYTEYLMKKSLDLYGVVIPYVQYTFMYDMQYRVREKNKEYLSDCEMKEYHETLHELLQYVDDDIICKPDLIFSEHRLSIFSMKYGCDIRSKVKYHDGGLYFHNLRLFGFNSKSMFMIKKASVEKDHLWVEGYTWIPFDSVKFYFVSGTEKMEVQPLIEDGKKQAVCFNDIIMQTKAFSMVLPCKKYQVQVCYKNQFVQNVYLGVEDESNVEKEAKKYFRLKTVPPLITCDQEESETEYEKEESPVLYRGGKLMRKNQEICRLKSADHLKLEKIQVTNDEVIFEGKISEIDKMDNLKFCFANAKDQRTELEVMEDGCFCAKIPVGDQVLSLRILYVYLDLYKGRLPLEGYQGRTQFVIKNRRFVIEQNVIKIHPMSKKERLFHTFGMGKGK